MIVGGQTEARAQLSSTIIDYHAVMSRLTRALIWQVDWVLVLPSCFVGHYCFQRVVVVVY